MITMNTQPNAATKTKFDLQPTLKGDAILLRPIQKTDFEELYQAASDPLIWEQHPKSDRYQRDVFQEYFDSAIESGGAFVVIDVADGSIIGSSRYYDLSMANGSGVDAGNSHVTIGYTFLKRDRWGGEYNRELKRLMMGHAFQYVPKVIFQIGATNIRSQRAIEKIGARLASRQSLDDTIHVIYEVQREDFFGSVLAPAAAPVSPGVI